MSKNRGNFITLAEAIEEFGVDATRFAMADAGDSMEDANFDRAVANKAIIDLFNEEEWIVNNVIGDLFSIQIDPRRAPINCWFVHSGG
jgi:leucyl-tRNA synthetase